MLGRDPALVVCHSGRGDGRPVGAYHRHLVGRVDALGAARGGLGALAAFAAPRLLQEEGADPGRVDEVARPGEEGGEEEVEEDSS